MTTGICIVPKCNSPTDGELCWYHRDAQKYQHDLVRAKELLVKFKIEDMDYVAFQVTDEVVRFNGYVKSDILSLEGMSFYDKPASFMSQFAGESRPALIRVRLNDWILRDANGNAKALSPEEYEVFLQNHDIKMI